MTENRKNILLGGMMALLLFFGLAASQSARAQTGVTLNFDPAEVTAPTCGTIEISLNVAGVTEENPLTAYHLEVTFDQTVVEVVSVENGGFLQGTLLQEPSNDLGNGDGRLVWGAAQQAVDGVNTPRSGDGSLIKITIKAKVAGGSTTFAVDAEESMLVDWPDAFTVDFTVSGNSLVTTIAGCVPTDIGLTPDSVKENELAGTTVGTFSATDSDAGETFTYSFVEDATYPDNALFMIDGNVLKTAVVFDHEEAATRLIKVRVTDSTGLTFDKEFIINILDINEAPIIDPIEPQTVVIPETLTFTVNATDPEGGTLTWSLGAGAPAGADIDPATGEFSWNTAGVEPGVYSFEVCVSDGVYLVCQTITVTVEANGAPIVEEIGDQTVVAGDTLTFTVIATDPEGEDLTYSLGDTAPEGATIDPETGEFSWDTTDVEPGDYTFDVCVSDGVNTVCETITVTVKAVLDPQPFKLYLPLIVR